ncbi:MAG: hypothetical protein HON98_01950 [Chloroflexi bacterium]|jgi:hypothetical protein|nr:hypothetical protein [Chloroflexota bacterium]MBT3670851.1 hypothetical protein [Chloroflexota bacterium]MBT4004325.1 hypothetical protein [Chloroflexota bacterium]MBT4305310.1 hypothetical protein [Chloroflexota bacterium]MBT4532456.1 hypothetical protein [Chloroflexota bacterium]
MDIFFTDPDDVPVDPEKVKVRALSAELYPDGRRVMINLEISPFKFKPNVEINIENQEGLQISSLSIVESMVHKMEFTVHLREKEPKGNYKIKAIIFYNDLDQFKLGERESAPAEEILGETRQVVARFESSFEIKG